MFHHRGDERATSCGENPGAGMGGPCSPGGVLAVELDAAGDADGVFILSAVAGLHSGDGRAGVPAARHVVVGAVKGSLCGFLASVVDFRSIQFSDAELGVYRPGEVHPL